MVNLLLNLEMAIVERAVSLWGAAWFRTVVGFLVAPLSPGLLAAIFRNSVPSRSSWLWITLTVHLTLPLRHLRPTFAWLENAPCLPFECVEEFCIAERAADGLGAAKAAEHVLVGLFR